MGRGVVGTAPVGGALSWDWPLSVRRLSRSSGPQEKHPRHHQPSHSHTPLASLSPPSGLLPQRHPMGWDGSLAGAQPDAPSTPHPDPPHASSTHTRTVSSPPPTFFAIPTHSMQPPRHHPIFTLAPCLHSHNM